MYIGEDEVSFSRALMAEVVEELMNLSFGLRRKDIEENQLSVKVLFDKISFPSEEDQVYTFNQLNLTYIQISITMYPPLSLFYYN